jgi:hypothetical protein
MLHNARLADCCMSFSSLRARLVGGGGGDSTISIHIISAMTVHLSRKHPLRVVHYLSCPPFLGNMISRSWKIRCSCPNAIWFSAANTFNSPTRQLALLLANVSEPIRAVHTPDHLSLSFIVCSRMQNLHHHSAGTFRIIVATSVSRLVVRTISALIRSQLFPTLRRAI